MRLSVKVYVFYESGKIDCNLIFGLVNFSRFFFNRRLEKWGFWQNYLPFQCLSSVHFKEIMTQFTKMIFFLHSVDANSQAFKMMGFHPLLDFFSDAYWNEPQVIARTLQSYFSFVYYTLRMNSGIQVHHKLQVKFTVITALN